MKPQFEPEEVFEIELNRYGLKWCRGECGMEGHRRGFVLDTDKKTVHLSAGVKYAKTLHRALHEIGHCVNDEAGMRSYQKEEAAMRFATTTMWSYGYPVPREVTTKAMRYIRRKKRHGDRIRKGRRL